MALGWDQALASAAVICNIPFLAAIPFQGQQRVWPKTSQIYYDNLLALASDIIIVSEGGYAGWKMLVRDKWMVNESEAVLALYNGDKSGGTFHTVQYANKVGKQVINLWDEYEKLV
jgi:uncharacterized phage-like protein YoqJ